MPERKANGVEELERRLACDRRHRSARTIHDPTVTRRVQVVQPRRFCERATRRRTCQYVEDARPSKTSQMRGLGTSQQVGSWIVRALKHPGVEPGRFAHHLLVPRWVEGQLDV